MQGSLAAWREDLVLKGVAGQLENGFWDERAEVHSIQLSLWSFFQPFPPYHPARTPVSSSSLCSTYVFISSVSTRSFHHLLIHRRVFSGAFVSSRHVLLTLAGEMGDGCPG